ncbi:MAG: hypothetical protein M1166_02460 [Candidatus Thermoplasmatota archaeon]|jgi:hypothetical protein|nr:hypothetical protein [Candidatus Thermoplasmatota archaeon]
MSENINERFVELMSDIRSYLRISAANSSREVAMKLLTNYEKALVYSKMDGKTSTYKIYEETGVPQRTVATWADDFVRRGLATGPNEIFSSHRALFTLNELLIDISSLKKREKTMKQSKVSNEVGSEVYNQRITD